MDKNSDSELSGFELNAADFNRIQQREMAEQPSSGGPSKESSAYSDSEAYRSVLDRSVAASRMQGSKMEKGRASAMPQGEIEEDLPGEQAEGAGKRSQSNLQKNIGLSQVEEQPLENEISPSKVP